MKVKDIMTNNSIYSPLSETLLNAAKLMEKLHTNILPVGTHEQLLGVITLREIVLSLMNNRATEQTKVSEIMSKTFYWCYEDEDLTKIAEKMGNHQLTHLIVVDKNKMLLGTISLVSITRNTLFLGREKNLKIKKRFILSNPKLSNATWLPHYHA